MTVELESLLEFELVLIALRHGVMTSTITLMTRRLTKVKRLAFKGRRRLNATDYSLISLYALPD